MMEQQEKKCILQVKNLHVHYITDEEEVYAVNGISFDLNEGEMCIRDRASAIRCELFMTSLLSGALETDTEISFYLPRSALTGLRSSKGFHTIPYGCIFLRRPGRSLRPSSPGSASRFRAGFRWPG